MYNIETSYEIVYNIQPPAWIYFSLVGWGYATRLKPDPLSLSIVLCNQIGTFVIGGEDSYLT